MTRRVWISSFVASTLLLSAQMIALLLNCVDCVAVFMNHLSASFSSVHGCTSVAGSGIIGVPFSVK